MPRRREIEVKEHLSEESLKELIRDEEDPRIRERLIFIRSLYEGDSVEKAADRVARAKTTGYNWLQRWNKDGLEGLKPNFGGGRPPKLSHEEPRFDTYFFVSKIKGLVPFFRDI